jgi:hypothetical protein
VVKKVHLSLTHEVEYKNPLVPFTCHGGSHARFSPHIAIPAHPRLRDRFPVQYMDCSSKPGLLLVEPDGELLSSRALLLSDFGFRVATATTCREIVNQRSKQICAAVLSDTLGPDVLHAAAESVRRQWTLAWILIVGKADTILEDQLYDEALDRLTCSETLLTSLLDLSMNPLDQSLCSFRSERNSAVTSNTRLSTSRRDPPESDPTKASQPPYRTPESVVEFDSETKWHYLKQA